MNKQKEKIKQNLQAAQYLIEIGLNRQAGSLLWDAARSAIFYSLKEKSISFSSSQEALKKVITEHKDKSISDDIIFADAVGTLCGWDEYFEITNEQILEFKKICNNVTKFFAQIETISIQIEDNKSYYDMLLEELSRHIEDAELSAATHYAAAGRFEKTYKWLLLIGFSVTLLGLTCFLKNCLCNSHYDTWSQLVALFGAGLTLWPLVKDYTGKAATHRRFAEEYNNLIKYCKNWRTTFPDENNRIRAMDSVLSLRNNLTLINNLTPATKYKDYIDGRKNIGKGSYKYFQNDLSLKNKKMNKNKELIKEWGENTAYTAKAHFKSADIRKTTITVLLLINILFAIVSIIDIGVNPIVLRVSGVVSLIASIIILIYESQNGKDCAKSHMTIGEGYLTIHYELQELFRKESISDQDITSIRKRIIILPKIRTGS